MTACAIETAGTGTATGMQSPEPAGTETGTHIRRIRRTGFTIAADGSYAACFTDAGVGVGVGVADGIDDEAAAPLGDDEGDGGGCWYPERWTLDGPEPYTVPLPGNQPEEPDSQLLPLPDGRVLIRRRVADRHDLALLYPTGPGTGELRVGFLYGEDVRLLPPLSTGSAYALTYAEGKSTVWLVHGGPGLEKRAEIDGHCTGGVWLDRQGMALALDREIGGRTKTVAVDLTNGATTPLLQITDESNDRLLLADPDSGLLIVRSDAPGTDRLGWGVLGSRRPVRFPDSLRAEDSVITPLSVQPGQLLMPESCTVALRIDGPGGAAPALWRPDGRAPSRVPVPDGWLTGAVTWSPDGTLRLPYATREFPCGLADAEPPAPLMAARATGAADTAASAAGGARPEMSSAAAEGTKRVAGAAGKPCSRVLPLQQAPLAGLNETARRTTGQAARQR